MKMLWLKCKQIYMHGMLHSQFQIGLYEVCNKDKFKVIEILSPHQVNPIWQHFSLQDYM